MTYTEEICNALIQRLRKTVTLAPAQLCAYMHTFDFWYQEVLRCVEMLDDYPKRYAAMRLAEREFVASFAAASSGEVWTSKQISSDKPHRRGLHESTRKELRRTLIAELRSLKDRGLSHGMKIPESVDWGQIEAISD